MLNEFLKEVIVSLAGKQAETIGDLLNTKKYVNEFIIAKKISLTINQTRNVLYKLSDYGLVSSVRKKDKRKGWYTYFWKIEVLKSLEFLNQSLLKQIEQLHVQIRSREFKQFYVCERCNIELNEESALLCNFTCNECGEVFTVKDNTKLLKDSNRELEKLEKKLILIKQEIEKEEEKERKQKHKILQKIARKKPIKKKTKHLLKKTKKKIQRKIFHKSLKKKAVKKKTGKIVKKKFKKMFHKKKNLKKIFHKSLNKKK